MMDMESHFLAHQIENKQFLHLPNTTSCSLLSPTLNPAELDSKIALLPPGSRYLVKHGASNIKVMVKEITESAKYSL